MKKGRAMVLKGAWILGWYLGGIRIGKWGPVGRESKIGGRIYKPP
jgi:hypothetical protein